MHNAHHTQSGPGPNYLHTLSASTTLGFNTRDTTWLRMIPEALSLVRLRVQIMVYVLSLSVSGCMPWDCKISHFVWNHVSRGYEGMMINCTFLRAFLYVVLIFIFKFLFAIFHWLSLCMNLLCLFIWCHPSHVSSIWLITADLLPLCPWPLCWRDATQR